MSDSQPTVTLVVCTRDRPELLEPTVDALTREAGPHGLTVLIVDQGENGGDGSPPGTTRIRDDGTGLSRARNIALARADTDWVGYIDDDCIVEPGFGGQLVRHLAAHPEADWLSGNVAAGERASDDGPPVTVFPVLRERVRQGRWTLPGSIGFGVFFCVRVSTARRLGGWDVRLGPGVPDLPAADDMDFNYRLLRSGGVCVLTPEVRVVHDQWRDSGEVEELSRGYLRAWSGFATKHLRQGDVLGGTWLWLWGVVDVLHMAKSAITRRSPARRRMTRAKLDGLVAGTALGLRRKW